MRGWRATTGASGMPYTLMTRQRGHPVAGERPNAEERRAMAKEASRINGLTPPLKWVKKIPLVFAERPKI